MGIGWLWHTTYSGDEIEFKTANEEKAANAYAFWLSLGNRIKTVFECWHQHWEKRTMQRALKDLPEYRLDDLGLRRLPSGEIAALCKEAKPLFGPTSGDLSNT